MLKFQNFGNFQNFLLFFSEKNLKYFHFSRFSLVLKTYFQKKRFLPISTQNFPRIPKIVLRKPCDAPKHTKTSDTHTHSTSGKNPEKFQKPSFSGKFSRSLKVTDPRLERKWSRPPSQEFYMFNNYIRPGSTPIFIAIGQEPMVSPRLLGKP